MALFTYGDFIAKVNEMGFILPIEGFPSEQDFIAEGQQWSGDPELDPWLWKDRAAAEKQLAYTSLCAQKKGFIAPRFYAIFYQAFHPRLSMAERWEAGKLGQYAWQLWQLLDQAQRPLGTHEYRAMLGVTPKSGGSSLDTAVTHLQLTFDVTLTGGVDMLDKHGVKYNTSVGCDRVQRWVPKEWMAMVPAMDREEAFDHIIKRAHEVSGLGVDKLVKAFAKQRKLCMQAD